MHPKRLAKRWKRKRKRILIPGYSSEADTADELGVTIRTLRKWRQRQVGPAWAKVGRQIIYGNESRAAWLKGQEKQPVRQSAEAA